MIVTQGLENHARLFKQKHKMKRWMEEAAPKDAEKPVTA